MKSRLIRLGITGALTALTLSAVAAPAQAVTCGPVLESVKICTGDDGRPYPVKVDNIAIGPVPVIGGAPMVGNTLAVFDGAWEPRYAKLTHQWLRNDVPVLGATGSIYRLTTKDLGRRIQVATTITAPNYLTKTVQSAKTASVTNVGGAIPTVSAPESVAVRWKGGGVRRLAAAAGIWPTPGIKFQYQWLRDGVLLPGDTASIHDSTIADAGKNIQVRITGYAPGFDPLTLTSAVFAAPSASFYDPTPGAVVTGGTEVGDVLTADDSVPWTDTGWGRELHPHTYQWVRNSVPIPGASGLTYTITAEDLGETLVLQTLTDTYNADSNSVSIPGPVPTPEPVVDLKPLTNVALPVLSPTTVAGTPLTASAGSWSASTEQLSISYSWFSADGRIASSGPTFTPGKEHIGKKFNVLVTAAAPGYQTAWVRVSAATPVTAPDPTQTKAPSITGSSVVGQKVTASGGSWSDRNTEVKRAFQWLRDGVKISGATGSTYTAVGADIGKKLSVTVTSAMDGRTLKTQTVDTPGIVAVATLQTATPTLTGAAVKGSVLTASPRAWTKGTVFKYRWLRNGIPIVHAYGATYRVRTADKDSRITVRITGSLLGYTTASRDSNAFIAR